MADLGFVLRIGQPGYPPHLAELPDAPKALYGVGDPSALQPGLAVIGARRATPYGIAAARIFAGWAAEAGYVVYSGAAIGCDQAAHSAALDRDGTTVAVMAGGADVAYPSAARQLIDDISRSGAVVSEHPWGTEPRRWSFRTRNRIIAGLCRVLLVVEARVPSGTFATVEYALDASRTVVAVPGSIFAPECRGPNKFIADGAEPISGVEDLARVLATEIGPPPRETSLWGCAAADSGEDALLQALRADPMRPDDAAVGLGLDITTALRRIGALEMAGHIKRYPDGRYGPC